MQTLIESAFREMCEVKECERTRMKIKAM